MSKVYMVHSESGEYSEWCFFVEGIFSSREKAVEYIESLRFPVAWDEDMEYCQKCDKFYLRHDMYDHKGEARAVAKDDSTWELKCGDRPDYDETTYFITEYEVNVPCHAT